MSLYGKTNTKFDVRGKAPVRDCEAVRRFFASRGAVMACCDDSTLPGIVRHALKDAVEGKLRVPAVDNSTAVIVETRRMIEQDHAPMVVLFVNRFVGGHNMIHHIPDWKAVFGDKLKVIAVFGDVRREEVILAFEEDADNVIGLPISSEKLVEKISGVVSLPTGFTRAVSEAKRMIADKQFERGKARVRGLLKRKPDSCVCRMLLGDIAREQGDMEQAETEYKTACENSPKYLQPLAELAKLYSAMGRTRDQLKILEKLDKLSPLNCDRKIDMGGTLLKLGDRDQAAEMFTGAEKLVRRDADEKIAGTLKKIGDTALENGDHALAQQYLEKSLTIKPVLSADDILTFNSLGLAMKQQGKFEEAKSCYERALSISDDANVHFNLGRLLAENLNRMREAGDHLVKALEIEPDLAKDQHRALLIGKVFVKAGRTDRAKPLLTFAATGPDRNACRAAAGLLEKTGRAA